MSIKPQVPSISPLNADFHAGLTNGAIVQFIGFASDNNDGKTSHNRIVAATSTTMLVRLLHNPGFPISLPGLPPNVILIDPEKFTHYSPHGGKVTMSQFPVPLAYSITDYKCRAKTFNAIVCDLKRPLGISPVTSAYVQLSHATTLQNVSIMRPFDEEELRKPLEPELIEELAWQELMAEHTARLFHDI